MLDTNLIGQGSTRLVYLDGDKVVKYNKCEFGYGQSVKELQVYELVRGTKFEEYFNPIYYVDTEKQICDYQQPYELSDDHLWDTENHTFQHFYEDIGHGRYELRFCDDQRELEELLDSVGVNFYDMMHGSNIGVKDGHLIFIDYGLTEEMLDNVYQYTCCDKL